MLAVRRDSQLNKKAKRKNETEIAIPLVILASYFGLLRLFLVDGNLNSSTSSESEFLLMDKRNS